jgi:hypothetical protein
VSTLADAVGDAARADLVKAKKRKAKPEGASSSPIAVFLLEAGFFVVI